MAGVRRGPRRDFFGRSAIIALAVGLIIGVAIGGSIAATTSGRLGNARKELAAARSENEALRQQSAEGQSEIQQLRGEMAALEEQLKRIRGRTALPSLLGKTLDEVRLLVEERGWILNVKTFASPKPEGTILSQSPKAGTVMRFGQTVTVTVSRPLPPGWKTIYRFSGSGRRKTPPFTLPDVDSGKLRVKYQFGGSSNSTLQLYEPPDEYVDLLVNEIGRTSGTTYVYESGRYFFEISGDSWAIEIQVYR